MTDSLENLKEKVLSCPFCQEYPKSVLRETEWCFFVACGFCQARGPTAGTREDAIKSWNDRRPAGRVIKA